MHSPPERREKNENGSGLVGKLFSEELLALRQENLELKQVVAEHSLIYDEDGMYYRNTEAGERIGPFCQRCYDKDRKLARLKSTPNSMLGWGYWCSICEKGYGSQRK